jgi:hypothetical protein
LYCELDILDDLVLNKLNPLNPSKCSGERLEEWLNLAHTENCKIRAKLLDDILHQPDEAHIEVFIHSLQKRLTILANELYNYVGTDYIFLDNSFEETLNLQGSQKITYFILENLLLFIRENFDRFFNLDEKPTPRIIFISNLQLCKSLAEIQSLSTVPIKFLNCANFQIQEFINHPERITYRGITYFEQLIEEILSFRVQTDENDLCTFIVIKLIYLNLNSNIFFKSLTAEFKKSIDQIEGINDKIEKISLYLKEINQIQVHPHLIYQPSRISIKDQLSSWLIEEMAFYEKKLMLITLGDKESINKLPTGTKVHLDTTVEELAYFLRIIYELKMFKEISVVKLTEFYAAFFNTKKSSDLSPGNLNKCYYAVDERTKERVKSFVFSMLSQIQKKNPCWLFLCTSFASFVQEPIILTFF